jgi:hypothetical protein
VYRIIFLLIFIGFFLASCSPAPSATAFDPNLSAARAQLTAEAAENQAQLYSAMATGTAQAPITHITETAAAISFINTQLAVDRTSTAISWTPTASPVPTITPSPTPNVEMTGTFAAMFAIQTQTVLQVQRAENTNKAKELFTWAAVAFIFALLFVAVGFSIPYIKRLAIKPLTVDERGRIIPMSNVLEGTIIDVERSANSVVSMKEKLLAQLPKISAERQADVTRLSQMTDLATRAKLPRQLLDNISRPAGLLPAPVDVETSFLLPSWELINSWDGKGIPYYTARGLEVIDTTRFPHLSAIGATGTGKSRRFFRPLIACALASGHRVVIIGKSTDYWPFEVHPNASLLKVNKITEPGQAERYAKILEVIIVEMNRRDDYLTSIHQSTWEKAGRSLTYIVLDELGNAFRLMSRETSNQCRIWVEGLVAEGRKFGFNIVISNQRATGMPAILSQTGRAIFRVDPDEEGRHRSLAGASSLHEGYFLAKFGMPKLAGGFEPTDEQIQQFLVSRPVNKIEDDDHWIDAVATDVPASLPEEKPKPLPSELPETLAQLLASLDEKGVKVVEMIQAGESQREIELAVYGKTGGSYYQKVKDIIGRYRAATTTSDGNISPAAPILA